MKPAPKPLRERMPLVTAFLDEMREAFGQDQIDAQIRSGMTGNGGFWACENGIEVGSRWPTISDEVG